MSMSINPPEASEQEATQRLVEANYRWNFIVNALDVAFFLLALSMVSQTTIMPLLVRQLTDSTVAIGLIPAISNIGNLLPQLLIANYSERLRRKKPFIMILSGIGERGPYLIIGILLLLFGTRAPGLVLIAFFGLLATTAASAGLGTPAWYDLIAKAIPARRRGLWAGVGRGVGSLLGVGGAALAGHFLAVNAFPRNFALCFFAASVALVFSWICLSLNRETDSTITKPRVTFATYLRQLPGILRRDGNYVHYLLARSLAVTGGMSAGFFMVYGVDHFGVPAQMVGLLTAVLVGSQALLNLLLGAIADRVGHKAILTISALCMGMATASVLVVPTGEWFVLTFALVGASTAGSLVSGLNIILEFCTSDDRPTYIGLTNTLLAPATLAPLIGAALTSTIGYRGMFVIALVAAVGGGLLLRFWVREPHHVAY